MHDITVRCWYSSTKNIGLVIGEKEKKIHEGGTLYRDIVTCTQNMNYKQKYQHSHKQGIIALMFFLPPKVGMQQVTRQGFYVYFNGIFVMTSLVIAAKQNIYSFSRHKSDNVLNQLEHKIMVNLGIKNNPNNKHFSVLHPPVSTIIVL